MRQKISLFRILKKIFVSRMSLAFMVILLCVSLASAQDMETSFLPSHTLIGHSQGISIAIFSPDGQTVLTGSFDTAAMLWDVKTGNLLHTLTGHLDSIRDAAFSPDSQTVVTGSKDKDAILWDVKSGTQRYLLSNHRDEITAVVFSPDGKSVVTASLDGRAIVWDVETGEIITVLSGHRSSLNDVAFSPDGLTILTGSWDRNGRLWNARTGRRLHTLEGHERSITNVAFSPDGKMAITASEDSSIIFWDMQTEEKLLTFDDEDVSRIGISITDIALSPDGKYIFTGSRQNTILWGIEAGKALHVFTDQITNGDIKPVLVAFSPDSRMILSGGENNIAILTDVQTGSILQIFNGHSDDITSIAFSPDGKTVLTASLDGTAMVWDISAIYESKTLTQLPYVLSPSHIFYGEAGSASFTPDSQTLIASIDNAIGLWDIESGRKFYGFRIGASFEWKVVFSPDGRTVLAGSTAGDQPAKLWDVESGELLHTLIDKSLENAAFSPDSQTVIMAHSDLTATMWDVQTGEQIRTLSGEVTNAIFSPNGELILTSAANGTLSLRDSTTDRVVQTFIRHASPVLEFAFSADGLMIVSYAGEGFASVWDTQSGKQLYTANDEYYAYWYAGAFTPDSRILLTSGIGEGMTHLWDAHSGELLRDIKGADAALSPDGSMVVTSRDDNSWATVWDTASGELLYILRDDFSYDSFLFSPDHNTIMTIAWNNKIILWDISGKN